MTTTPTNPNEPLRECPWCAAPALVIPKEGNPKTYRVACSKCAAEGAYRSIRENAVQWWNRRYQPAAQVSEEQIRKCAKEINESLTIWGAGTWWGNIEGGLFPNERIETILTHHLSPKPTEPRKEGDVK